MLMRRMLFVLGMLIFLGQNLLAQERTVSGKVLSPDNTPVPGATISVQVSSEKGSSVAANADGSFTIRVPVKRSFSLFISAVGYDPQTIPSSAIHEAPFNVTLKANTKHV